MSTSLMVDTIPVPSRRNILCAVNCALTLERAVALGPTGAIALLVLAGAKLMLKSDEAAELYAGVTKEHDLQVAWLGLAAACH